LYVGRGFGGTAATSSVATTLDGAINSTVTSIIVDSVAAFGSGSGIDSIYQEIIRIDNERMKVITGSATTKTLQVVRDYHATDAASHSDGADVVLIDQDKEFLADLVSTAQTYSEGQVFVSTGKFDAAEEVSSGYILMNANPNDISTPYMQIVERTGSDVYDLQLRAQLGDLSGLSSGYLYGDEEPGFGIYTDNGYFRGGITAQTGSIKGRLHINTSAAEEMILGRDVSGTDDGLFINSNNYWYTTGLMKVGTSDRFMQWDGANLTVQGKIIITSGPAAVQFAALNSTTGSQGTAITNAQNKADSGSAQLDTLQTRVEIDTNGMSLRASNGTSLADYGTTTRIGLAADARTEITSTAISMYSGKISGTARKRVAIDNTGKAAFGGATDADVAIDSTDDVVSIQPGTGVFVYDNSTDFIKIASDGMYVHSGNASNPSAHFGTDIELYANGSTNRSLHATAHGVNIGPSATGPSSDGTASAVVGNVSVHSGGVHIYGNVTNTFAALSSNGLQFTQAGVKKAIFGAITVIGSNTAVTTSSTNDCIRLDGASNIISIFQDDENFSTLSSDGFKVTNANQEVAVFAAITLIGDTDHEHVRIEDDLLQLKDGSAIRVNVVSGSVTVGQVAASKSNVHITDSGVFLRNNTTDIISVGNGEVTVSGSILERTRLFGSGTDGVGDFDGTSVAGASYSDPLYTLTSDRYFSSATLSNSKDIKTNGFRLFVKETLTIASGCVIHNDGSNASGRAGGEGGAGNSLHQGTDGTTGGGGGAAGNGGNDNGGPGGGGGGSGGFVFISARKIANSGTIRSHGGNGGNGGADV